MRKVTKINKSEKAVTKNTKIRVAAYCRVSTGSDEQLESLETQKEHYSSFIRANPEWEYAGLYYDEGITGTKKKCRKGLLSLISDCKKGLIDLVYTKSISRLSRNTTDCLEIVRQLLDVSVFVYFEKENINTGSMKSELMLSVLSSIAENESFSISKNEQWSIQKRFQKGTYVIACPPYGYENNDKGELVVVPEQAEIVKRIFKETLAGKGTTVIARAFNQEQVSTKKGGKWTQRTIADILHNEKYTGDAIFQKTYTDSNFNRHINRGEKDMYLCKNHHEPIVSHEDFEMAQQVLKQRGIEKGNDGNSDKYSKRYAFSSKIICGECGSVLKRRKHYLLNGEYIAWCCSQHIENKDACSMKYITDDAIKNVFLTMMNKLVFGYDFILKPLHTAIIQVNIEKSGQRLKELDALMKDNVEQRKTTAGLLSKGYIDRAIYLETNNKLLTEKDNLKSEKEFLLKMNESGYQVESDIKEFIAFLSKSKYFSDFDEKLFSRFVYKAVVISRKEIEFEFKFGLKLRERL